MFRHLGLYPKQDPDQVLTGQAAPALYYTNSAYIIIPPYSHQYTKNYLAPLNPMASTPMVSTPMASSPMASSPMASSPMVSSPLVSSLH